METLIAILIGVAVVWFSAIGIALVKAILKLEKTIVRYDAKHERTEERLDGHDDILEKHDNAIFKKAATGLLLFLLLVPLTGCSLLGLDMEQIQADAQETSSALDIVTKRIPALESSVDNVLALYDAAIEQGDLAEAKRLLAVLKDEIQKLNFSKDEKTQLTETFNKQVTAFKEAKDTNSYITAFLSLFGGSALGLLGLGKVAKTAIKKRDKIITVTAGNIDESNGDVDKLKKLQKQKLDSDLVTLLDKLRAG